MASGKTKKTKHRCEWLTPHHQGGVLANGAICVVLYNLTSSLSVSVWSRSFSHELEMRNCKRASKERQEWAWGSWGGLDESAPWSDASESSLPAASDAGELPWCSITNVAWVCALKKKEDKPNVIQRLMPCTKWMDWKTRRFASVIVSSPLPVFRKGRIFRAVSVVTRKGIDKWGKNSSA